MTAGFDELIHPSTRLSVMALLAAADWAEFSFIRDALRLSDSALSKQLSTLEDAGYLIVDRIAGDRRRRMRVRLTPTGRSRQPGRPERETHPGPRRRERRSSSRWGTVVVRNGRQVIDALSDGREATSSELRDEIPLLEGAIEYGQGKSWGGKAALAPRVLTVLSGEGTVVRATNDGDWSTSRPRWALTEAWLGGPIDAPGSSSFGSAASARGSKRI